MPSETAETENDCSVHADQRGDRAVVDLDDGPPGDPEPIEPPPAEAKPTHPALAALLDARAKRELDLEVRYRGWIRRMASVDAPAESDVQSFEHLIDSGFEVSDDQILEDLLAERTVQAEQRAREREAQHRARLLDERFRRLRWQLFADFSVDDLRVVREPLLPQACCDTTCSLGFERELRRNEYLTSFGCRKLQSGWVDAAGVPVNVDVFIFRQLTRAYEPFVPACRSWLAMPDGATDLGESIEDLEQQIEALPAVDDRMMPTVQLILDGFALYVEPVGGPAREPVAERFAQELARVHGDIKSAIEARCRWGR